MSELFTQIEDKALFLKSVKEHFQQAPGEISWILKCDNALTDERVEFAYDEYKQNLAKFSVLLRSKNPDHYKRAGALLHALYRSKIIIDVHFDEKQLEDLETGFLQISYGDAQHILKFVDFYKVAANEILSFDLAFRYCATYERAVRVYDVDYLLNVCHYLQTNTDLSVDSCFMLYKSLMHCPNHP
jgi:hypothetical protein